MQASILDIDTAILTKRTVVRRFREGDGPAFYELLQENHTRLMDHFPHLIRQVTDKNEGEYYVRRKIAAWLLQEEFTLGIWDNDSARLIGAIRLYHLDWTIPRGELTFFIDQFFSGRNLMTEALAACVRFAFTQLGIKKLQLRTAMDNYAAQRLARKVGFRREGDLREEYRRPGGELIDVMLFGLTFSEFDKI